MLIAAIALHFAMPCLALRSQEPSPRLTVSIDAGFGHTSGGGSPRVTPASLAFGATVAAPINPLARWRALAGISVHANIPLDYGLDCTLIPPSTECLPVYPRFTSFALLAGRAAGPPSKTGEIRILAGPALLRTDEQSSLFGLQARFDLTAFRIGRAGFGLWAQGAAAPIGRRGTYTLFSSGLALRF